MVFFFIENFLAFKLGTGEVDETCFDMRGENSGVFLSRPGAIRLLSTIVKSCKQFCLRENWNENRWLNERNYTKEVAQKSRHLRKEENRNFVVQSNIHRR